MLCSQSEKYKPQIYSFNPSTGRAQYGDRSLSHFKIYKVIFVWGGGVQTSMGILLRFFFQMAVMMHQTLIAID